MNELTRDVNLITSEILIIKKQTVDAVKCAAFEIGKRLIEAKALVPSGEWLPYLEERLGYKTSTAENMMRIYRDFNDRPQFAAFDQSQLVSLFGLSDSQQMKLLEDNPHLDDMSSREIKRLANELKAAEKAKKVAEQEAERERKARENADKIAAKAANETEKLKQDAIVLKQEISDLDEELGRIKTAPAEVVPDPEQEKEINRLNERVAALTQQLQEAESKPEVVAVDTSALEQEIAQLRSKLASAQDLNMQKVALLFTQVQEQLTTILRTLAELPEEKRAKVSASIRNGLVSYSERFREVI